MSEHNRYCTFRIGGQKFGMDVRSVQEVLRYQPMTPVPLAPPVVQGLLNRRGRIVAAIDLRIRLEMSDDPRDRPPINILVNTRESVVSFLVDELSDVESLPADRIERVPDTLTGIMRELVVGCCQMDDGLLLILNIDRVACVKTHWERKTYA